VKREATVVDINLVLDVLWRRPEDIPCSPDERHAFHAAVIMAGLGFRPGSITGLLYDQVALYVKVDDAGGISLFAEVTIHHEKQQTNEIHDTQDEMSVTALVPVTPLYFN
jgi:hypothetical protein